ncbi:MAG: bifunctional salicylyl-CoA 5-hydroxylase/oxidoreductase [SAR324 cluster bacterium]|nr:bifunctional salicylyl-CoA 5-hydroxylase/oxidoreductase [SAR324 cluster bacterium]
MKVLCVGGGPGGLYFAISMKLRNPAHHITVVEQNRPHDTFGWGVVFSDQTLENLEVNDPVSAGTIKKSFAYWDNIDVFFHEKVIRSEGHGFIGIGRLRLLNILQERASELGIELVFETLIEDFKSFEDYDLVVAADGLNSKIRTHYQDFFLPDIDLRKNKFIWLGTHRLFEAFSFIFKNTEHGWFWAHAYRFEKDFSTFIIECEPGTWLSAGIDKMSKEEGIAYCEEIFSEYLEGHSLIENAEHLRGSSVWINFPRVVCQKWYHKNIVLLGDAVHTAHFSIGSGTKLALEDAISLADALHLHEEFEASFQQYQEAREVEVLRLQNAARNSTEWFENLSRYTHFDPTQFAYSLLTRSQRISHENLRMRDKRWLESVECWFAEKATGKPVTSPVPPMFTPYVLREMKVNNRVAVSPMAMYSAQDGEVNDFHLVHLGSRAMGGAGLIFTEMTAVSREARITPGCTGMYEAEHVRGWKRIVDFVHNHSQAKIVLQLGHAGPKGSTKVLWEGQDMALEEGGWPLLGPSPIPYKDQIPEELTTAKMQKICNQFVESVKMAEECDFDMIELHCAHGYLLSSFITPLSNHRKDEYGGSLPNRLRFPVAVFKAMRAVWPAQKPMSVRISAHDWVSGGIDDQEAVKIAQAFYQAGADIIHVSSGQTHIDEKPVYGRMFQTPFADRIRNDARIPTIAVGAIFEPDHINSIIAAGRADLCCLARPHLSNPYWTLHAAAQQDFQEQFWPVQYSSGKKQMELNLQREKQFEILK